MIWADRLAIIWFVIIFAVLFMTSGGQSAVSHFWDGWVPIVGWFVLLPWAVLRVIDAILFSAFRNRPLY